MESVREIQLKRFAGTGIYTNSQMNNTLIKEHCAIDNDSEALLKKVFEAQRLSPRAMTRILKVARTIADLSEKDKIGFEDIAEAIQYKTVDKKEVITG